jgi:hypothetical protein
MLKGTLHSTMAVVDAFERTPDQREPSEMGRILIDSDGNPSLNLDNPEVQAELRKHIEALASIKIEPINSGREAR